VLDSVAKGKLADQGSVKVIKLDNGLLSYRGTQNTGTTVSYNTITTPTGGQYQVVLADGTKVWINAASSLRFPTVFSGTQREVELKGEGYFEVTPDPSKTFVVKVNEMKVKVLGTHFNIMAYEDEESVNTTLLKGSVKLEHGTESRMLIPGEQGRWNKKEEMQVVKNADLEEVLAWKNGRFQYHSTNLRVIMRQIARWYNVTIVYEGNVRDEYFSGSIPRTDNVSQVLKMLELTNTIHFTIEGKSIIVKQ
jgi:ferric-dicitrate binding protein FerR (iron transport regulator)